MDIIFFAALAFIIFLKLNKQLGKIDEEEKKQIEAKLAKRKEEVLAIQSKITQQYQQQIIPILEKRNQIEEQILQPLDATTRQNFSNILQRCNISAEFFVSGAKSAFEMIIKAFAAGDLETLKILLADKIYQGFENAVNQRKAQETTLVTNLISIEKAEIISAMLLENFASIVVKIVSKQINYVSDKGGQVIEGRKDEISELTDIWTFKKDVNSPNPNWVVCATSN
ncbi:MAG: hypothetical protein A3G22_05925 [Alphaproteobacteria bacterium RIFCSPLOWO2_12_FULL_40_11]|nr:MAG: hypothetical protein A3G22_05925 [Alphaproteobacteria bacterium RIFCSPLOWO2_12_FULL_40_11]